MPRTATVRRETAETKIELTTKRKDVSDDYQRKTIRLEICDLKIQSDPIGKKITLSDAERERERKLCSNFSFFYGRRERKRGVEEDLTKCYKTKLKIYILNLNFFKKKSNRLNFFFKKIDS